MGRTTKSATPMPTMPKPMATKSMTLKWMSDVLNPAEADGDEVADDAVDDAEVDVQRPESCRSVPGYFPHPDSGRVGAVGAA